jgi:hypothetical protein
VPFVAGDLPPAYAATQSDEIIRLFQNLGRTTTWNLIEKVHFQGDTFEPEGMVRIGEDRYFVSAGEYIVPTAKNANGAIINGTDRTVGAGFGHIMVFDGKGNRIADATLSERGAIEYHFGGIDYDGEFIWATISQYRPNSTATVLRIDPRTLEFEKILSTNNHEGGIVHDTITDDIVTLNWGARNASTWNLRQKFIPAPAFTPPRFTTRNPSYFIDYQDCKFLGRPRAYGFKPVMLCSGITNIGGRFDIGGIAVVDMESMIPVVETPITMLSDQGAPVTKNPVDVAVVNGQLRLYWLPDERNSSLFVYEAQVNSPYQY